MFAVAALSACVVLTDHESCLKPLADKVAAAMSQCDFQIKRLAANVAAAKSAKEKANYQADLDSQKKRLDRLTRRPVEVLAELHAESPFGLPAGTVGFFASDSVTVLDVGDGFVVLQVLSYASGSGGRSEQKTAGVAAGGMNSFSTPVLEKLTVSAHLPGAKKGAKFKLSGWYRVTESGGTKAEYTASAVPFKFSESDISTLLRLADQSDKRR